MRTLKRTLCLVLCLVMMVGLVAISANAAYKDEEKIEYAEAVGVLSLIKVLDGYEDGTFRPEGTLTRAEAAKIMSQLLNAKGEGPKVSSFTDMAAAEWAQPYVAYCEAAGIIAGFGDGTFRPMEKLTTAQFAKMLLCAIGYDAEREGLVNDTAWEINTVKLVNTIDLAADIPFITWDSAEYITRDQAAKLAFNTLLATMVEYDANGIYFLKDGTPTNPINNIRNVSYSYVSDDDSAAIDGWMQFCEYHFPTLKVAYEDDDFGIPCRTWFLGANSDDYLLTPAKREAGYKAMQGIMVVYDDEVAGITGKKLAADAHRDEGWVSFDLIVNGEHFYRLVDREVDGVTRRYAEDGFQVYTKNAKSDYVLFNDKPSNNNWDINAFGSGFAGATVYLIDTNKDGAADRMVVEYPFLAKVIGVTEGEDRTITLEAYVNGDGNKAMKRISIPYETEDFARGDYVLVYTKGAHTYFDPKTDEVIAIKAAESVNGALTKINLTAGVASSSLTLDGKAYPAGSEKLAVLGPESNVVYCDKELYFLRSDYTAFLSNGYAIGVLPSEIVFSDYIYVVKGDVPATPGAMDTMVNDYASSRGYLIGYIDFDAKLSEFTNRTKLEGEDLGWYKSTKLERPAAKYLRQGVKITTLDPTVPSLGDDNGYIVANDATIFLTWEKNARGVEVFHRYEGIKNVPAYSKLSANCVADALVNNGFAVAVFIDLRNEKADVPPTSDEDAIFIIGRAKTKEVDGDDDIFTYNAIVDGKKVTLTSTSELLWRDEKGKPILDQNGDTIPLTGLVIPTYANKEALKLSGAKPVNYTSKKYNSYYGVIDFMKNSVRLDDRDGKTFLDAYKVNDDAKAFIITGEEYNETVQVDLGSPDFLESAFGRLYLIFDKDGYVCELYFHSYPNPNDD